MVVILLIEHTQKEVDKETPYPFPPELGVLGNEDTVL